MDASDGAFGVVVREYDVKTKSVSTSNINNDVDNSLVKLGENSSKVGDFSSDGRNKFFVSGLNGKDVELNETLAERIQRSSISLLLNGVSSRRIGSIVDLDLNRSDILLSDNRNEFNGKALIFRLTHVFNKLKYVQIMECIKTGLNDWKPREISLTY
jgi:hypothetical protein